MHSKAYWARNNLAQLHGETVSVLFNICLIEEPRLQIVKKQFETK